ncbi:MAG: BlaI/MecI/CopY family transcriptional regulator [Planctomycetes bacterium]|nr:BlaI/MecI/CopY family transcriptional regulator [Planctomycetota bacterium]
MDAGIPHVTAAELRILKVLWRIGQGTVRDVKDELEKDGAEASAYTTVMTLMNQLATKGGLRVDRDRQPFVYAPAIRRERVLGERLMQFLANVFDGQAGELVLRLVEEADLSAEDLKRIEERIESREKHASQTRRPRKENPP